MPLVQLVHQVCLPLLSGHPLQRNGADFRFGLPLSLSCLLACLLRGEGSRGNPGPRAYPRHGPCVTRSVGGRALVPPTELVHPLPPKTPLLNHDRKKPASSSRVIRGLRNLIYSLLNPTSPASPPDPEQNLAQLHCLSLPTPPEPATRTCKVHDPRLVVLVQGGRSRETVPTVFRWRRVRCACGGSCSCRWSTGRPITSSAVSVPLRPAIAPVAEGVVADHVHGLGHPPPPAPRRPPSVGLSIPPGLAVPS